MSAPLLSLPVGEVMRLHPAFAAFINGADDGAAKPDKILGAWIAGLSEEDLGRIGMERMQVFDASEFVGGGSGGGQTGAAALTSLRLLGGRDKSGREEKLDLTLRPGEIDLHCRADRFGQEPPARRYRMSGAGRHAVGPKNPDRRRNPDPARRWAVSGKLVAQLSQNMNFVVDLTVGEFIAMHADCRGVADREAAARDVIACANHLAGEKFTEATSLTQLSGGQSRALMIADVALLSTSPIVLIDEIENAGIDRKRALDLLVASDKIVLDVHP